MTLHLKTLMSKIRSFHFKKAVEIADSWNRLNNDQYKNQQLN